MTTTPSPTQRQCHTCRTLKDEAAFRRSYHGRLSHQCISCDSGVVREKIVDRHTWVNQIKADRKCSVCGNPDPAILGFYRRKGKNRKPISQMLRCSQKRVLAEMDKCDLLCRKCHGDKKRAYFSAHPSHTISSEGKPHDICQA
jgi:hypothetical protein